MRTVNRMHKLKLILPETPVWAPILGALQQRSGTTEYTDPTERPASAGALSVVRPQGRGTTKNTKDTKIQ
jgi:hypothetical protein